ncbi:MAG: ketoacyl-ACP synthase III [Halanaerobiaceae bacterium]
MHFPDSKPLIIDRYAEMLSVGIGLPKKVITNQHIIDNYDVIATDRAVQYSLGIKERRWASSDETPVILMARAVKECLEKVDMKIEQIDRVIYSSMSGNYQVPATSIGLLKELESNVGIPAFDITSACSGFVHAMDLAIKSIASGDEYVIVIGGNVMGAPLINESHTNNIFLLGDGIVAMLLGKSDIKKIYASYIITNHELYDNAYIEYGTELLKDETDTIKIDNLIMKIADGNLIHRSTVEYSKIIAEKLLSQTEFSMDDMDYFITSDQSTRIWEEQLLELDIPEEKSVSLFYRHGNTVAAMSPLNLNELIETERLKRGDLVMMQAHGAGASSGGIIFRY